jgi:hypothetical protein
VDLVPCSCVHARRVVVNQATPARARWTRALPAVPRPTPGLYVGRDTVVNDWVESGFEGLKGLRANSYRSGLDVVIEGTVARVSDTGVLARLAQMWRDKLDWVFHVGDGVFLDSQSTGVALVFAVTPSKILAFTKAPYSQTRYLM